MSQVLYEMTDFCLDEESHKYININWFGVK